MTNRIVIALVAMTLMIQGVILYRQSWGSAPTGPRQQPTKDAPKGAVMDLAGLPVKGSSSAKVILVEFSDYECPFCSRHATGVGQELEKEFIATGKVRKAFANNPLPMHLNAKLLATAAICAGRQNRYWEMHDALFSKKPTTKDGVQALLSDLAVDPAAFQKCVDTDVEVGQEIARDTQKAKEFQLSGTPSFGIGRVDSQGHITIDKFVNGAQPIGVFEKAIGEVLSKANAS
jgi:protein-disulfide isomerase